MTIGVTAPLTALATAGVKYNATMETYLANLTTLLGGNEQAAEELLNTLREMANTTPFEIKSLLAIPLQKSEGKFSTSILLTASLLRVFNDKQQNIIYD